MCINVSNGQGETVKYTLPTEQGDRTFWVYVPSSYQTQKDWPLVLDFHDFTMDAYLYMQISGMRAVADTGQFIVVYPQGEVSSSHEELYDWGVDEESPHAVNDIAFIRQILDKLAQDFRIDQRRIYATGWNVGGMMCHRLACLLGDRIAAIATVGGTTIRQQTCPSANPVPVLFVHTTHDPLSAALAYPVTYEIMSPQEFIAYWRDRNQCATAIRRDTTAVFIGEQVVSAAEEQWTNCESVVFSMHPWRPVAEEQMSLPGDESALMTSARIWQFFRQQRHPGGITSLDELYQKKMDVQVYPNPAQSHIFLKGEWPRAQTLVIRLLNVQGQTVAFERRYDLPAGAFHLRETIPAALPAGLYYAVLGNASRQVSKVLVLQEP